MAATIIIVVGVVAVLFFAIRSLVKNHKNGGACASCGSCNGCPSKDNHCTHEGEKQ